MRSPMIMLLLVLVGCTGETSTERTEDEANARSDAELLIGTWEAIERDTKQTDSQQTKHFVTFDGEKMSWHVETDGKRYLLEGFTSSYSIDETTTPKRLDATALGIYKFEGDDKLVYCRGGNTRPKEFGTSTEILEAGGRFDLLGGRHVFRRVE